MHFIDKIMIYTVISIVVNLLAVNAVSVFFQPEKEYRFDFEGSSTIKDVGTFSAKSKIGVVNLGSTAGNETQHCLLIVYNYNVRVQRGQANVDQHVHMADMDFSNWLSFDMDSHGHINAIYFDANDESDAHARQLKKKILGVLSNRLVISEQAESDNTRWGYRASETGEEGEHTTTYQAEPDVSSKKIVFKKKKLSPDPLNSFNQKYEKEVHLDREMNIPKHSQLQEEFISLENPKTPIQRRASQGSIDEQNKQYGFPQMQGQGQVSLTFDRVVTSDDVNTLWHKRPFNIEQDTLVFRPIPEKLLSQSIATNYISGNLTCMVQSTPEDGHESRSKCFHDISKVMSRVTYDDLEAIVESYIGSDAITWSYVIDALGATQTNDSLVLLTELVFASREETFDITMTALAQLVALDACPPKFLRNSLARRVFDEPWQYPDEHQTNLVNERALLVIASVARATRPCNTTWSNRITTRLQEMADFHDPYEHRLKRDTLSTGHFKRHVSQQAVKIMALSNDAHPSSFVYLLSYLNDTESHIQLRCSAVRGIGRYEHEDAALALLRVAMQDPSDTVRYKALDAYSMHPQGGDIREFIRSEEYLYSNLTAPDHKRMRRSLADVASAIWGGFHFRLETPSFDWEKMVGGTSMGASMGLIIQNFIDIDIAPVDGEVEVNVYDKAYATAHLGILGFDLHFFLADMCYKGKIEYDLNILSEYDFEEAAKTAVKLDKVIETVVDRITTGIANFKNIVSSVDGIDIGDVIEDFIQTIRDMPKEVFDLRKVAKKLLRSMDEYTSLPPVMDEIRDFVRKVMKLFNDIKTDIMTLYNSIVDTVETTLPWAWRQIKTAFNGMVDAVVNILENPLNSLQGIGRGIVRISLAIGAIIDAKDTIIEANIFADDNRPYWFDFDTVFEDLTNDTIAIADSMDDTFDWLYNYDERVTSIAGDYTGVDINDMKWHALAELWSHINSELLGPFDTLRTLLDPFILTYQFITTTVEKMKEAWTTLVDSYNYGRTLFDAIFGKKFHKRFPSKFLTSERCGDGFWESDGDGEYTHPGIDLIVDIGDDVYAPFSGNLSVTGPRQVTIDVSEVKNMEIIIDNVEYNTARPADPLIGAGEVIGTAATTWCSRGHLHVSMRDQRTGKYVDPSRFKQQRPGLPAAWVEECDHYELVFLGITLQIGSITGDPEVNDDTPVLENAPDPASLQLEPYPESETSTGRRRRTLETFVDTFANFTMSLGLGAIEDLTEIFRVRLDNITLNALLNFLGSNGLTELEEDINVVLEIIQELGNYETCTRPESMDDNELQRALFTRGLSSTGSRAGLEKRLRTPDTACTGLSDHITPDSFCTFDPDCLGLSCCVDVAVFDLFRYSIVTFIKVDPCDNTVTIGIDSLSVVVQIPQDINDFEDFSDATLLDIDIGEFSVVQLTAYYEITHADGIFTISVGLAVCSNRAEECSDLMTIADGLTIAYLNCSDTSDSTQLSSVLGVFDTGVTVADFIDQLDSTGLSEDEVVTIIEDIREAFVLWVERQIEAAITEIFDNILEHNDLCMVGFPLSFGPYQVQIFRTIPPITFPLGWFTLIFEFGLNGYYGVHFHANLCLNSMEATATITPVIGAVAWGSVGIGFGPFQCRLLIEGNIMTTEFPTNVEIGFAKFPLDVKAAMDLKLTPLKVTMFGEIIFSISTPLFSITETILSIKIWEYTSPTIHKRIFGSDEIEPDLSPPNFIAYEALDPVVTTTTTTTTPSPNSGRRKRDISENTEDDAAAINTYIAATSVHRRFRRNTEVGVPCDVEQVAGKDYTEPTFSIQYDVADDVSQCETTLCIGTYRGGCDVLEDEPLGGTSSEHARALISGLPLYFTVTSTNSGGGSAHVLCEIPTYDTTLPTGRVTAEYRSTSHPGILRCSMFVTDDSEISIQQVSAGFGQTAFATQLVQWTEIDTGEHDDVISTTGDVNDPLAYFAVPKLGRLVYEPFESTTTPTAADCAEECRRYPISKCMGFNFDYGASTDCELLQSVEGHAKVEQSGSFYYFERLGVGSTAHLDLDDVELIHDTLAYCNVYLQNVLGYENFMGSEGIHVDFTPPDPGHRIEVVNDTLQYENCVDYTPEYLQHLCAEQTSLPNYRFIDDVAYSNCTLCNGHTRGEELFYTRANRMVSCNWDYIHDNETGILLYTWGVGTAPCEEDIHPHQDPHAHIFDESEWTHEGVAFPLDLADGIYHVVLNALNEVDFGGPMALHICHQTPYVIDTTPPVINYTAIAMYDPETHDITMNVSAADDLSLIQYHQLGLGRSQRDTYILHFETVESQHTLEIQHQVPDGVPTWVKVRVANYVDLRSTDHSPRAIFIDASPPLAGFVEMGDDLNNHLHYQSSTTRLCATWQNFYDSESGLSEYEIGFGTDEGLDDIMEFTILASTEYSFCQDGFALEHNHEYYATIIATNGATISQSVNASSLPVLVDITAPTQGSVRDGAPDEEDTVFSSSASSVAVTWEGFEDPESDIHGVTVSFKKQVGGSGEILLHQEDDVSPFATDLEFHHFNLDHDDYVFTQVNVTNGAMLMTDGQSDGFRVDLTDPVLGYLVDGGEEHVDVQYWSSTTSLSANWEFSDGESGITSYKASIFTEASGLRQQIYPDDDWMTLDPDTTTWSTGDLLTLTPGHLYFTRVMATNGASLTAIFDTDGVIIDPTAPEMLYVRAGVLAGESEETVDGYVVQNDPFTIRGSWRALDAESGIVGYLVGVGTSEGADDILPFATLTDEDAYLEGFTLELTNMDLTPPAPLYYITVMAQNGATEYSDPVSSSPIRVVEEDREGIVWDGTGSTVHQDIDYQLDRDFVSMRFYGFESALHGIDRYEWAIGSQPRYDDVMPFTSYGIIVTDENTFGLGSNGYATISFPLQHAHTYYITVRATTGAGATMDVSTDGVTIDTLPAVATITRLHDNNDVNDIERLYQADSFLEAEWSVTDEEGSVARMSVAVGTVPGGDDVYSNPDFDFDSTEPAFELAAGVAIPREEGMPNFITVTLENQNGLLSSVISPPVAMDSTPPTEGTVDCPLFAVGNIIKCSLWDFEDLESGMSHFDVALGYTEGGTSVSNFTAISAGSDDFAIAFDSLENLSGENQEYYVTVLAVNNALLSRRAFSGAIYVDNTPPVGAAVVELADYEYYDVASNSHFYPNSDPSLAVDAVCQRDTTRVHIAWGEFTDAETEIDYYDIALGTAQGGTQIVGFTSVDATRRNHVFQNLNLGHTPTVYATVRGYNKAGLHTTVFSNGVHISRLSAGLSLAEPLLVYDGTEDIDLDFQDHIDSLSASWRLDGDPCPFTEKQWSVHRFDEEVIQDMQDLPEDEDFGYVDEVSTVDRQSFYVKITAKNALNHTVHLHSDGITVEVEPVIPGTVRDGVILGTDLSYQLDTESIGCHWEGFGVERLDGTFDNLAGGNEEEIEVGDHQGIFYYEVAIGTDRTSHSGRTAIRPFTNVGTNTSKVFEELSLEVGDSIYYCTVRAYSVSTASVEVTSNGISVGHGGVVLSEGTVNIDRYVASENELRLTWDDFAFSKPVLRYYWGLASGFLSDDDVGDCDELALDWQGHSLPSARAFEDAGLDAIVTPSNLGLTHAHHYTAIVLAIDETGTCSVALANFTVDITDPVQGILGLVDSVGMEVIYHDDTATIVVEWPGYRDDESGIAETTVSLFTTDNCRATAEDLELLPAIASDTTPGGVMNYTFRELDLQFDTPYYIVLYMENGAALSITEVTNPILLDVNGPSAGYVVDGVDYLHDKEYLGSTTEVSGSILYLPSSADVCAPIRIDDFSENDFREVIHKGLWAFPTGKQTSSEFLATQVEYDETFQLHIDRRVSEEIMKCAAVNLNPESFTVGKYEFSMRIADQTWATTAVTFWDGPPDILVAPTDLTSSDNEDSGQVTIIEQALEGDTFSSGYALESVTGNGFGMLARLAEDENSNIVTELVLWGKSGDEYRENTRIVSSDYSQGFHSYRLVINEDGEVTDMRAWEMKLYVDDVHISLIGGIHGVYANASVTVGVFNHAEFVPEVVDNFNPPTAKTEIESIEFPNADDTACNAWKGGDQPVLKFLAGIGTEVGVADVVDFREVWIPDVPCEGACSELFCNQATDPDVLQSTTFTLSDLNLEPNSQDTIGNDTEPLQQAYFITVKALVGSGKTAVSSSNGFYIDITPPEINTILYFDVDFDDYQPVTFQGNNHTIQAIFYSEDPESEIEENFWAMGSTPCGTDIQDYVSVSYDQSMLTRDHLEDVLQDGHTYYVTIKSVNKAGLEAINCSEGVTVLLYEPDVSDATVDMSGADPVGTLETNCLATSSQSEFTAEFEPPAGESIGQTTCGMGTSEGSNDICPSMLCGDDGASSISVSADGASVGGGDTYDLDTVAGMNEVSRRRRSVADPQLLIEPGQTVYMNIECCTHAHICARIPTEPILIVREADSVISVDPDDGRISTTLATDMTSGSVALTMVISTAYAQDSAVILITGSLSEADVQAAYGSDASTNYNSSTVDPQATISQVERPLVSRIRDVTSTSFFMTAAPAQPINGPIIIEFSFDVNEYPDREIYPHLLAYCPNQHIWVDAGETCGYENGTQVDWDNAICNVTVCNLATYCAGAYYTDHTTSRRRRDTDETYTGTSTFAIASASSTIINYPPILDSDGHISIDEDPGVVEIQLEGLDPENDTFIFLISDSSEHIGSASLATDGVLTYSPCEDCFGNDVISIILREVRDDDIEVEETETILNISITAMNDNPRLVVMQDGDCLSDLSYQVTLVTEEYSPDKDDYVHLEILFGGYDVDGDNVNIYYGTVDHGDVLIQNQVATDEYVEQDCSTTWASRRDAWRALEHDIEENTPGIVMIVPCDIPEDVSGKIMQWTLSLARYTPDVGFYGVDTIEVSANDDSIGLLPSELLEIEVHVLANPCLNSATCKGPDSDPDCTSLERANGFDGYSCDCAKGFKGSRCQTNIDDCKEDSCSLGYKCVDQVNGFKCECESGNCLPAWAIALIVIIVVAVIVIVVLSVAIWYLRKHRGDSNTEDQNLLNGSQEFKGKRNDAFDQDSIDSDELILPAAPGATFMPEKYQTKQELAVAKDMNPDYRPATSTSAHMPDESTQKTSGDDMAKTNKKPKGGFSLFKNKKGAMPKQPKGAKTIKVKGASSQPKMDPERRQVLQKWGDVMGTPEKKRTDKIDVQEPGDILLLDEGSRTPSGGRTRSRSPAWDKKGHKHPHHKKGRVSPVSTSSDEAMEMQKLPEGWAKKDVPGIVVELAVPDREDNVESRASTPKLQSKTLHELCEDDKN